MVLFYSFGVITCASTEYSDWHKLFPRIRSKIVTLFVNMAFPIYRELVLSWGACDSSATSLNCLLSQSNDVSDKSNRDGYTSNALFLNFGGAQEAFYSKPNTYKIFLNERKGFIRLAMQNGAGIVPTISFGDTDIFDTTQNDNGSTMRKFQELFKRYTTIAPIFFNGRGLFQKYFGFVPKRRPITVVFGEPILCEKNSTPSKDQINEVHALFRQRLIDLFETHKSKYVKNYENVYMEII